MVRYPLLIGWNCLLLNELEIGIAGGRVPLVDGGWNCLLLNEQKRHVSRVCSVILEGLQLVEEEEINAVQRCNYVCLRNLLRRYQA